MDTSRVKVTHHGGAPCYGEICLQELGLFSQ